MFHRVKGGVVQRETISLGMMGPVGRGLLNKRAPVTEEEMFVWLKGLIERIAAAQNLEFEFQAEDAPEFEPSKALAVTLNGDTVGRMGLVNKTARDEWRLIMPIAAAELDLAVLLGQAFAINKTVELAQFPAMSRDIALIVDETVEHEQISKLIKKANPKDLESFGLFDVYQGKGVEKGKKSLAYTFTYRSAKQTLTDKKVNKAHEKLTGYLLKELGATLRDG